MGRRRDGAGGGKCSSRDQPPLPTSHCARDKTRARLSSHAHAHTDDPVASSLLALPRKPALPPFLGRGGSASSELSPEATRKAKKDGRATSCLPCLPGLRRPIPRPEPRSLPPHPSGFHADRARSRVCPHWNPRFSTSDSAREPRPPWVGYGERSARREAAFREVLARNL